VIKTHVYTETCIKRSPLEQRKVVFLDGLPFKRGSIHMKFLWQDKKKWCFKTGDSLIEVMSWAGFTAFLTFLLWGIRYFWKIVEFEVIMWYKYISCDKSMYISCDTSLINKLSMLGVGEIAVNNHTNITTDMFNSLNQLSMT